MFRYQHFFTGQQFASTGNSFHFVGTEQGLHALSQLANNLGFAGDHGRNIDGDIVYRDTVSDEVLACFHELVGRVQKGL